jgi:transposase-like protein
VAVFKQVIATDGILEKVAIDKSSANLAALKSMNVFQKFAKGNRLIKILQVKYLNNTSKRTVISSRRSPGSCLVSKLSIPLVPHFRESKSPT